MKNLNLFLILLIFFILFISPVSAIVAEFSYIGGTATASSSLGAYLPNLLFDDVTTTFWSSQSPGVMSEWVKFDFGAGTTHKVSKYIWQARNTAAATDSPTAWYLQGSNDNSVWTNLDRRTAQSFTDGEIKTYASLTESVNQSLFRYYRMYITAGGSDVDTCQGAEWELWGEDPIAPVASFTPTGTTTGTAPLSVQFTDTSTNTPTSWKWGRNNLTATTWEQFNTSQNPQQVFVVGNWQVNLTATNAAGSNISTQVTWVNVSPPPPPVADFTVTPDNGMYGSIFQFNDTSTGTPTMWNYSLKNNGAGTTQWFNGTTVAFQNLSWISYTGGNYTAQLWAQSAGGGNYSAKKQFLDVWNWSPASFTGTPLKGASPLQVTFSGSSNNATNYYWEFGDGNTTSNTLQNPLHLYTTNGVYNVNYRTKNIYHTGNWSNQSNYITVNVTLAANFAGTPLSGYLDPDFTVNFVDMSTGADLYYWCWTFGDGSAYSYLRNPSHTYTTAGVFNVDLFIKGSDGVTNTTKNNYINAYYPPNATAAWTSYLVSGLCPVIVNFTDQSGNATSVIWDFGDGNTSTERNSQHSYEVIGSFTVNFTANNTYSSAYLRRVNYIVTYPCVISTPVPTPIPTTPVPLNAPVARFLANTTAGSIPLVVHFYDLSLFNATSWAWDFGDGNTSALQNPTNIYYAVGTYTVSLVATNAYGSDSVTKVDYIIANIAVPGGGAGGGNTVNFVGSPRTGEIPLVVGFTDLSSINGTITAYNWSLGDGSYSIVQNPYNTYNTIGTYTISLNVTFTSDGGATFNSTTATKTDYINALAVGGLPTVAVPSVIPMLPAAKKQVAPVQWIDDRLLWVVIILVLVVGWLVMRRR